jgi:lysozyme
MIRATVLTKIAATFILGTALSSCNSTTVLESMDSMPRSEMTTSSITPTEKVDTDGIEAGSSEIAFVDSDTQNEATQVASLRPESVKSDTRNQDAKKAKKSRSNSHSKPKIFKANFSDRKPVDFGKAHPKHFDVHGVDVSRWQYDIDWKQLRTRGANFAFIKSTEGGDHLDPMFKKNWEGAKAAGVPRGAYHFFYWCRVADEQADWFIRNVPKEEGALPPVIDVEWNNHSKNCPTRPSRKVVLAKMKVFMDKVEKHYGQKPIIYTAPDFYEDNLQGQFKDYPFWLRSVAQHPKGRYPNRDFVFWQYSGTGLSKGHGTEIDLNVFNGSVKGWHKWLGRNIH